MFYILCLEHERTWSSLSLSSSSELDSKSRLSERLTDFSEEEASDNNDDIDPKEGHYTKVPPEPRHNVGNASRTRLSFKRSKKKGLEKRDSNSPVEQPRAEKGIATVERSGSFSSSLGKAAKQATYSCYDLLQVKDFLYQLQKHYQL